MSNPLHGITTEIETERKLLTDRNTESPNFVNEVLCSIRRKILEAVRTGESKVLALRWRGQDLNPCNLSANARRIYEGCVMAGLSVTLEPEFKHRAHIEFVRMYVLLN